MKTIEMPSTWAGLGVNYPVTTFSILHHGCLFSGIHSLEIEDEILPVVATIEKLYLDNNGRDVLSIISPAIVHFLEEQLAQR